MEYSKQPASARAINSIDPSTSALSTYLNKFEQLCISVSVNNTENIQIKAVHFISVRYVHSILIKYRKFTTEGDYTRKLLPAICNIHKIEKVVQFFWYEHIYEDFQVAPVQIQRIYFHTPFQANDSDTERVTLTENNMLSGLSQYTCLSHYYPSSPLQQPSRPNC